MRKKMLLALCMAVGMTISSVLPAYASENMPIAAENETTVPEAIPEEEELEELPEVAGDDNVILYQGKVWVVTEDGVQDLSGDIEVKDIVERNLGYYPEEYNFEETSEIAFLDENNTLYYYTYDLDDAAYRQTAVIQNVRDLYNHGYVDQNGTYHIWSADYAFGVESHPQEIHTIDNVKRVMDNVVVLDDETSISYSIYRNNYIEDDRFDFAVEKNVYSCILDNTNCLWKYEYSNDGTRSLVKWDENVSDCTQNFYLKDGNCYSVSDKTLVKEDVDSLVYGDDEVNCYIVWDSDLYETTKNSDGVWEFSLYVKNYEKMIARDLFLTKDRELWSCGTESSSSRKIMTSVAAVYNDRISYVFSVTAKNYGVCILRTDGTVWKWTNTFWESDIIPKLVFEPEEPIPTPTPTPDPSIDMEFTDVRENDWYYDSVSYVNANGLMTGLNSTIFGPGETLSRAQFAVILHRMNDTPEMTYLPTFPDVPAGYWFTDAVLWANKANVVTGYSNGYFGTSDAITREQMALMMYRYANYKGYDTSVKDDFSNFKDAACVSSFASEAMKWAVGNGIITGKDNGTMIDPQGNAARAECATIIMRFLEKYEN